MKPCHCIFAHAVTPEARKRAVKLLEAARITGNHVGIVIAMTQLGPCPAQDQPDEE